jgi:hypothetical protein
MKVFEPATTREHSQEWGGEMEPGADQCEFAPVSG